jgi:glycosyltransferase involved in cell wall biosynthesis
VKSDVIAQPAVVGARPRDATPLSRRLRVLMIVESSAGGTGRHVLDLCDGLIAAGCDVHLVHSCRRIDQMFIDRLAAVDGLRCLSLPIRTSPHPADIGVLRAIRRYARQHGPFDIVHGHSSKGGALARLAALGTPAAAFYTLHGLIMMDDGLSRVKRAFYLAIELGLSLRTKRIIAVSPEEARAAVRMGLGRSRVMTIPNGIDELELTPRGIARRMMRVDDGDVVIGFVGRLVEQKSPHVLIEAFARAAGRSPRARLVIVGAGPLESSLRQLAFNMGVVDRIRWMGEVDARSLFAGFDLFAISSRKEGLPYVVLEAMSAGLAVVATKSSGVEILIEPDVNGSVVPTDDPAAMGEALSRLAADAALRARFGRASRARIKSFSVDAMVRGTLEAYRCAVGCGSAGPGGGDVE